jgi:putative transposase
MREVLHTLVYQNRTGCQWDLLPHDLLPKSTVSDYFRQGRDDGTWPQMLDTLREAVRQQAGRHPAPSAGSSDAQPGKGTEGGSARSGRRDLCCGIDAERWREHALGSGDIGGTARTMSG